MSQHDPKTASLMTSVTKNPHPQPKIFFRKKKNKVSHWQQATIEITCHDQCIIACSCHIYIGIVLCAHPASSESHIQCKAYGEVATTSLLVTMNRTDRTLFL